MQQRRLTRKQLEELTLRWEIWEAEAATTPRRIVRARLHLLFLLIRYGGLRLGEARELHARCAVDTASCMLHVPAPGRRDVLLPVSCMKHVRRILSLPEAESMGADFLRFDPGFVRRKFYEVARPLEMDSTLVGPRALRYARGLELLELHVPFTVVQKFLGQEKHTQVRAFLDFAGGEARRMASAARRDPGAGEDDNTLLATVLRITIGMRSVSVDMTTFSGIILTALCPHREFSGMDIRVNQLVTAHIDPDQITLAAEKPLCSQSNSVAGVIEVLHRERVETFVCAVLPDGTKICSNQETAALDATGLREQQRVWMLFPSRAVRVCRN